MTNSPDPDANPTGTAALRVAIRREPDAHDLPLPAYATRGAAGVDLHCASHSIQVIQPGERASVPTGIRIAVPEGYEAQVRPRSGLARDHGIGMVNAPGTIDSDYRGEVHVLLINLGTEPFVLKRGDRIAQLAVCPVIRVQWEETAELPATPRGEGGFGHSGR